MEIQFNVSEIISASVIRVHVMFDFQTYENGLLVSPNRKASEVSSLHSFLRPVSRFRIVR
jgi:hypothetical protein